MAIEPALDPAHTAVLSMDMQTAIVSIYTGDQDAFTGRAAEELSESRDITQPVRKSHMGDRMSEVVEGSTRNHLAPPVDEQDGPQNQASQQGNRRSHPLKTCQQILILQSLFREYLSDGGQNLRPDWFLATASIKSGSGGEPFQGGGHLTDSEPVRFEALFGTRAFFS